MFVVVDFPVLLCQHSSTPSSNVLFHIFILKYCPSHSPTGLSSSPSPSISLSLFLSLSLSLSLSFSHSLSLSLSLPPSLSICLSPFLLDIFLYYFTYPTKLSIVARLFVSFLSLLFFFSPLCPIQLYVLSVQYIFYVFF